MHRHQFSKHLLGTNGLLGSVLRNKHCKKKNSNIKFISQYRAWEVKAKNGHYNPIYSLDIRALYIALILPNSPPLFLCPLLCDFSMPRRFVMAFHIIESFR